MILKFFAQRSDVRHVVYVCGGFGGVKKRLKNTAHHDERHDEDGPRGEKGFAEFVRAPFSQRLAKNADNLAWYASLESARSLSSGPIVLWSLLINHNICEADEDKFVSNVKTHRQRCQLVRQPISIDTIDGLSDLARDSKGDLWAVPERNRALINLSNPSAPHVYSIEGIPDGTDTEALTFVGDKVFLGTETRVGKRPSDSIFIAAKVDNRFVVTDHIELPYALWNMTAKKNKGIEGLTYKNGILFAGVETVLENEGERYAPIGRYNVAQKTWTGFRLQLTSDTGKLSALASQASGDQLIVLAIERDYDVCRVLRFTIDRNGPAQILQPQVVIDLSTTMNPLPNLEGLVENSDGSFTFVVDNFRGGQRTGPNELIHVK